MHPAVTRVVLHGSRGPQGGARPGSDIDLSLAVDVPPSSRVELDRRLREVLATTLDAWRGPVELDLAAVFDIRGCDLACFDAPRWPEGTACPWGGGRDCFGVHKVQRGFDGFVEGAGVEVARMHPCVTVWRRPTGRGRG